MRLVMSALSFPVSLNMKFTKNSLQLDNSGVAAYFLNYEFLNIQQEQIQTYHLHLLEIHHPNNESNILKELIQIVLVLLIF